MAVEQSSLVSQYPEVTALTVLALGLLLAIAATRLVTWLFSRVNALATDSDHATSGAVKTARQIVFWTILAFTLLLSMRVIGKSFAATWHEVYLDYAAQTLVAFTIIALGYGLGRLVRDLLSSSHSSTALPEFVFWSVVGGSMIIALDQIGLNLSLLTTIVTIAAVLVLSSLALAFALGSKDYVANLVAQDAMHAINVGDRMRIDSFEGVVVQIRTTGFDIAIENAIVTIPASWLHTRPVIKVVGEDDGGA